jgi:hypothetical protein
MDFLMTDLATFSLPRKTVRHGATRALCQTSVNGCVKQSYLKLLSSDRYIHGNSLICSGFRESYLVLKDLLSSCIVMLKVYVLTFDLPLPRFLTVFATVLIGEHKQPTDARANHVTRHNTPIYNILSTAPQLSISQKALGILPEDGNVMAKHVGATIHN